MKVCLVCNTVTPIGSKTCPACGEASFADADKFAAPPAPAPATTEAEDVEPIADETAEGEPTEGEATDEPTVAKPKRKRR